MLAAGQAVGLALGGNSCLLLSGKDTRGETEARRSSWAVRMETMKWKNAEMVHKAERSRVITLYLIILYKLPISI